MSINLPLVSICIPTYNNSNHLIDCLDSIASQTYSNIEVIICDNCSSDNTFELAKTYASKYNWICLQNSTNIGALSNFNKLISLSTGEYVGIYHADDIYDSDIVSLLMERFIADPHLNIAGTGAYTIDDQNNITSKYVNPFNRVSIYNYYSFHDVISSIVKDHVHNRLYCDIPLLLITPSFIVKKKAYDTYGGFDVNSHFKSASDYEMWIRLSKYSPICIINKPLMKYRIHNAQASQVEIRNSSLIPDIHTLIFYCVHNLEDPDLLNDALYFLNRIIMGTALKQNRLGLYKISNNSIKFFFGFSFKLFILKIFNILKISIPRYKKTN